MAQEKKRNEKKLVILLLLLVVGLIAAFFFIMQNPPGGKTSKGAVRVYFIKGEKLSPVERKVPEGRDKEGFAIAELLKGPSKEEAKEGILSHLPPGTKSKATSIEDGMAFVNFSEELEQTKGGAESLRAMVAQIVYTLTDIPGVKKIRILVDGRSEVVLGGEGYVIDRPLTRKDVKL